MKKIVTSVILVMSIISLKADNRIIMYINQAPDKAVELAIKKAQKENIIQKINNKLDKKTPAQMSKKALKTELKKDFTPKQSGFLALYAGYSDYSNSDGLISFPLRHNEPKVYLVITKKVKLTQVKGETIAHLEFDNAKNIEKAIYLFEKKKDENTLKQAPADAKAMADTQNEQEANANATPDASEVESDKFYWSVTEVKNFKSNIINPISVVILTKPENIYIVTGDFMTDDSKNLILPQKIYSVGNVDNYKIILKELDVKRYFEPVDEQEEKSGDTVIKKMLNNI